MTWTWPTGVMTALVTPLTDDELDVGALGALIEYQIAGGVVGVVIGGGTGEYGALSIDERVRLAREAIRLVDGRVATVVQTGALSTRDSRRLGVEAQDAGADALLVASPFGEPINWNERFRFYENVTASTSLPMMIYNTPPSGLLTLQQVHRLAELPNVTAIKDSSGDPVLMGDLLAWSSPRDFAVYVGLDSSLYEAVGSGARGAVFGAANVVPRQVSDVARDLIDNGPSVASHRQWLPLRDFLRFMEQSPNYMALCKAGCALNGVDVGAVREPYLPSGQDEIDELARRLSQLGDASLEPTASAAAAT